jgi:predicted nuclease of predicted toxin-antitoxin system
LPLNLITDENIDNQIVFSLRDKGFDVLSIKEYSPGLSDKEILKLAVKKNAIIISEDSDFGEWIFVHKEKSTGIIFLRYSHHEISQISEVLIDTIQKYQNKLFQKFVVITPTKIRIRDIILD